MFSRLVKHMAEREGVSEELKTENQMEWVGKMNTIREAATEIVSNEHIDRDLRSYRYDGR